MLPQHIQEREDRKTLDLLSYAMRRNGVDQSAWQIAACFESLSACDDCVCLYGDGNGWIVAYTERGAWREMARFRATYDAIKFFYAHFHPGPSPFDISDAWEAETGQEFSMVE